MRWPRPPRGCRAIGEKKISFGQDITREHTKSIYGFQNVSKDTANYLLSLILINDLTQQKGPY
jgi:hypothetical protein